MEESPSEIKLLLKDVPSEALLARDAVDPRGRVLLAAGSVVTDKHIKIFKSWGVSELYIRKTTDKVDFDKDKPMVKTPLYEKIEKEMDELFRFMDHRSGIPAELFKIVLDRKINILS